MSERFIPLPGGEVKKSNLLVRTPIPFESVWELRIIDLVASVVNERDAVLQEYLVPAKFCASGRKSIGGREFSEIDRACDNLTKSNVRLPCEGGFDYYPLFAKCGYRNGLIRAQVHPDLLPHFLVHKRFTLYSRFEGLKIPSGYSKRLHELLKSYDDLPEITIPLTELHEVLDVSPSLRKQYSNFVNRVLVPGHEHIKANTSLIYDWKAIKSGRRVVAICFVFDEARVEWLLSEKRKREEENQKRKEEERHKKEIKLFTAAARCLRSGVCRPKKNEVCRYCQASSSFPTGNM